MLSWSTMRGGFGWDNLSTVTDRLDDVSPAFGVAVEELAQRCACPVCSGLQIPQDEGGPLRAVAANGKPIFTLDQAAAQLTREGRHWGAAIGQSATVTYSYLSSTNPPPNAPADVSGFGRFNEAQIVATEKALQYWMDVANISFVRVGAGTSGEGAYSDAGTIRFGNYSTGEDGAAAFAYFPPRPGFAPSGFAGDIWVNSTLGYNSNPVYGDYGPHVLLHEIGHAIGLSHPGDYNADADTTVTYANDATYFQDSRQFTVMSYFGSSNTGGSLPMFAAGPQMHDIAAAQRLYGANMTTRTGDTVYGFNSNTGREYMTATSATTGIVMAIWDAGGNDTIDVSGYSQNATIDLREEQLSSAGPGNGGGTAIGNIGIARGAVIENAITGAGNDRLTGNAADNRLTGNAGNDTLDGGAGADTLIGGLGNDTYVVDALDTIVEAVGEGIDTVRTSASQFNLTAALENLTYTGTGSFIGVGTAADNTIIGGAANDYFYTLAGNDSAEGGAGVDVFVLDVGADTARGGDGQDYFFGGDGVDTLYGDAGVDVFNGELGDDIMFGGADTDYFYGGLGADTGNGEAGNDIFVMDVGNDTANGGDGQDYFYMGEGDDVMVGGAGVDVMLGEAGNDIFDGGADVDYLFLGPKGAGDNDTVIVRADTGVQVVYDFEAGGTNDAIRLIGTNLTTFAQVQAAIFDYTASGGFIVIAVDSDTLIWLIGVTPQQLTAADFIFG